MVKKKKKKKKSLVIITIFFFKSRSLLWPQKQNKKKNCFVFSFEICLVDKGFRMFPQFDGVASLFNFLIFFFKKRERLANFFFKN